MNRRQKIFVVTLLIISVLLIGVSVYVGIKTTPNHPLYTASSQYSISQPIVASSTGDVKAEVDIVVPKTPTPIVVTDLKAIRNAINNATTTISLAENPPPSFLYSESDIVSKKYADLPYYFIGPNHLIVKDKTKFMVDLGYNVMRNVVVPIYGKYVTKVKPDFSVLPKEKFPAEYRRLQIKRFNDQLLKRNKIIESNNTVLAQARITLAQTDPAQLADIEKQAETIQKGFEEQISELNSVIKDLSDPAGQKYKESEIITGGYIPPSTILFRTPVHSEENPALDNLGELERLVVHESLHYYADVDDRVGLDKFFFEGFTEYLALKALGYSDSKMLEVSGYPMHVEVIAMLAEKIPLSTIEKINFTQDSALFESTFRQYFPTTDYKSFMDLADEINTSWFTSPQKVNSSYVDDPLVLQARTLLKFTKPINNN